MVTLGVHTLLTTSLKGARHGQYKSPDFHSLPGIMFGYFDHDADNSDHDDNDELQIARHEEIESIRGTLRVTAYRDGTNFGNRT